MSKEQASAYQGAFEAVLAVPIATGFGYWVDYVLETAPIGLFVGAATGFAALVLRLTRMRPRSESDPSGGVEPESKQAGDHESGPKNGEA